jgi:HEPN domain-containing protein/predicted nucleotidyltransferase
VKTSLSHLPEDKQQEIQSITESIVQLVKPEMVILFGSYSRGDWVEDRHIEDGITVEYKSDYDILVVTGKPQDMPHGLGKDVRRKIKKAEHLQTTPHIIFHDIKFLNTELEEGHYFFADIVKEGTMLYNTGGHQLATAKELSPVDRANKAKVYFDEWFSNALDSWTHYNYAMRDERYKKAAFELHQAAENLYKTIILVFTDYKPKTHDLDDLNKQVGYADVRFKTVFPNQTDEDKRRFTILVKAYIDSRYKLGYTVDSEDLKWLAERVGRLKELTEAVCNEKIEQFLK